MGLYPDSSDIDSITGNIKERILIGIFGSFKENKAVLDELKEFLRTKGVYKNVYTAEDFPYEVPAITEGEAKYGYSYDKSMALVHACDIAIIFFFNERGDCQVNESTVTELQALIELEGKIVIVESEAGYVFRTNIKGIKYISDKKWWDWDDFSQEEISDLHVTIKQKCHNKILERFVILNHP